MTKLRQQVGAGTRCQEGRAALCASWLRCASLGAAMRLAVGRCGCCAQRDARVCLLLGAANSWAATLTPLAPAQPPHPHAPALRARQVVKLEKALQPLEQHLEQPGEQQLQQQLGERLEEAQQQQREQVQQLAAPAAGPFANNAAHSGPNGLSNGNGSNGAVAAALNGVVAGHQHVANGHAPATPAAAGPARATLPWQR